jgi:ElaB/YqjD/DUF883 family membrane-anchored ribosome-binding protein
MDSTNNLTKQGQGLADKAVATADELGSNAAPLQKKATSQAQAWGKQGIDAASDMGQQVRDTAADAFGSVIAYTKRHPATALAVAVASGALLFALVKAMAPSRD